MKGLCVYVCTRTHEVLFQVHFTILWGRVSHQSHRLGRSASEAQPCVSLYLSSAQLTPMRPHSLFYNSSSAIDTQAPHASNNLQHPLFFYGTLLFSWLSFLSFPFSEPYRQFSGICAPPTHLSDSLSLSLLKVFPAASDVVLWFS